MKCPGQDSRYWKPEAVYEAKCPECGHDVEFFKDEPSRKCPNCGFRFINPKMDFGCASYCKFAEQCLGDLPPELLAKRQELLKDRVAIQMKRYFGRDFKRIGHATKVARYCERMVKEIGGEPAVVLSAAYLHDIGIHEAEKKYKSTAARYQHQEGPPIARNILENLDANEDLIEEVCDIIGHHHHPRKEETLNFKILYDADLIVNLEEKMKETPMEKDKLERIIEKSFLTKNGRELARTLLINQHSRGKH